MSNSLSVLSSTNSVTMVKPRLWGSNDFRKMCIIHMGVEQKSYYGNEDGFFHTHVDLYTALPKTVNFIVPAVLSCFRELKNAFPICRVIYS